MPWRVYVSSVVGGDSNENREVVRILRDLAGRARQCSESETVDADALSLDVVFKVGGPFASPDFEGVIPGRWSEKKRLVVIQVAVPEDLDVVAPGAFVAERLRGLAAVADDFVARRGIVGSLEAAQRVLRSLADSLDPGPT